MSCYSMVRMIALFRDVSPSVFFCSAFAPLPERTPESPQVKTQLLLPLIVTQALSAFNSNQLRAALLILVSFRGLNAFGLSAATTVGLSTIAVVAPYFLLSIPAGRISDRFSKTMVLRGCKAFELVIFAVAGLGLYTQNAPLLLLCLFMAGIEAALMGPAKMGILPELVGPEKLVPANAWMGFTNSAAILFGMISGNLLVTGNVPMEIIALTAMAIAAFGFAASLFIPVTSAKAPQLSMRPGAVAFDFAMAFSWLRRVPLAIAPILGISWFWFQGTVNTTLIPLYVEQAEGQPETMVATMLVVASIGVGTGALLCRLAGSVIRSAIVPVLVFAVTALAGADLGFNGLSSEPGSALRVLVDVFLISAAAGFYVVPLAAALQTVAPDSERARFIGLCNTLTGLAMTLSGSTVIFALNLGLQIDQLFFYGAVLTGLVAFVTLSRSLRTLHTPERATM